MLPYFLSTYPRIQSYRGITVLYGTTARVAHVVDLHSAFCMRGGRLVVGAQLAFVIGRACPRRIDDSMKKNKVTQN
jgi:hypothetical protein